MATDHDYATLNEAKEHLQIDDNDDNMKLQNVVTSVSRWIDNYTGRHFWQDGTTEEPVARYFDTRRPWLLKLGMFNDLVDLIELATDASGNDDFAIVWSAGEYRVLPRNSTAAPEPRPYTKIRAIGARRFPIWGGEGQERIRISGVWGWPEVPAMVHEALLIQTAKIFKRRDAPEGVVGFDQFGVIRISGRLDPDVELQLLDYVHPAKVLAA